MGLPQTAYQWQGNGEKGEIRHPDSVIKANITSEGQAGIKHLQMCDPEKETPPVQQ